MGNNFWASLKIERDFFYLPARRTNNVLWQAGGNQRNQREIFSRRLRPEVSGFAE